MSIISLTHRGAELNKLHESRLTRYVQKVGFSRGYNVFCDFAEDVKKVAVNFELTKVSKMHSPEMGAYYLPEQ